MGTRFDWLDWKLETIDVGVSFFECIIVYCFFNPIGLGLLWGACMLSHTDALY